MLNFVDKDGQHWTNVTAEHEEQGGMDPTEFRWSCGLSSKHFHLAYDERCWYFSEKATKEWRKHKDDDQKCINRIFGSLFTGK